MKIPKKVRNKATGTLLLAALIALTHSMHGGNIAYIHGDISRNGITPSSSDPNNPQPFEQMLLTNTAPNGLSQFRAMVEAEGHTIDQYYDQTTTLNAAFLNQFDAVIFGLHQKIWSAAEKNALDTWLQAGGGMMGYSDSASGGAFDEVGIDNPIGQNVFNNLFSQYGMTVTVDQASGTISFQSQDPNPNPLVAGLQLEGEGVSPIVVDSTDPLVEVLIPFNNASIVATSAGIIWSNNGPFRFNPVDDRFQGVTIPYGNVIPSPPRVDACIALRPVGNGNVIGFFDRQPLFNATGPGSDITKLDNEEILRRIINFLAEDQGGNSGDFNPLPRTNWTVSASNNNGGANFAIDGIASTRWATAQFQTPGQLFTIDLGAVEMFSRIELDTAANPNDYPRGYIVSVSNDGANYTTVSTGTGSGTPTTITFADQTARYIQIEQTGSSPVNWWSIHEVNVFETASMPIISPVDFQFNDNNDEGWARNGSIEAHAFTAQGEYLVRAAPNSDPFIFNNGFSFSGSETNQIRVGFRAQAAGPVQLFWGTTEANNFSANRVKTLNYATANAFEELTFDMSQEPDWAGKVITQLRVDTTTGPSPVHTWFDYIVGDSMDTLPSGPFVWNMNSANEVQFNNITATVSGGLFDGQTSGNLGDPFCFLRQNNSAALSINANQYKNLKMRVFLGNNIPTAPFVIYFWKGGTIYPTVLPGNAVQGWHVYEVDLSQFADWNGTVTMFRLDFVQGANTPYDIQIDYVGIEE